MSHPDPLYPCEDFDMATNYSDYHYDYHDDFYDEDDRKNHFDDFEDDSPEFDDFADEDDYDDSMDGDHESGLASAGWGTDEDYGYYGDDY
jgi:hypothetical protein